MNKQPQLDKNGFRKFGFRDKVAYAAGDFGCNMSFSLKSTVQTFWLAFMLMETGLLSILMIVVQIWDAVNDPLIGSLIDADHRKYKRGKFKTYIFIGACGLLLGGAAVFLPFPNAPTVIKAVLFIFGYIIWDAFYTIANVPYGSMLSLVTTDEGERAQLSTWRSIGSIIGTVIPMAVLPMIIWKKVTYDGTFGFLDQIVIPEESKEWFTQDNLSKNPITGELYKIGDAILNPTTGEEIEILLGNRVFFVALIMGVIGFASFMLMLKFITVRADESTVKANEGGEKFNIFKAFGKFMKNRAAVGATLAGMGMVFGTQSITTANTIMFATHFKMARLSGIVQLVGVLPMILFIPFVTKIVKRFGKKESSAVGSMVSLAGSVVMMLFPLIENKTVSLIVYVIALVIYGLGLGIYSCVCWALMGDAIDYNELRFGTREEGVIYSLHSFFRKLAQGLGPSLVIVLMGWLGYDSKLGTIGQSAQTAKNMCWIVVLIFLVSALFQFIGLTFVYNLDKKRVASMSNELNSRKSDTSPEISAEN